MSGRKIDQFFTPLKPSAKRVRSNSSPDLDKSVSEVMAGDKVGDMSVTQLMEVMGALLDQKMASLATKLEVEELSNKVGQLSEENARLKAEIAQLNVKENVILCKIDDLESRSRRNNLIFKGLTWKGDQVNFKELVARFCNDKLGARDNVWVNRAHRLGRSNAIIAHFPDDSDVDYIMRRTFMLKGTGVVVHRDYTRDVRMRRSRLMAVREEVERRCGNSRRMPLFFDHLLLGNCRFTWENNRLMAGREDGAVKLQEILGRDFTEFLTNLAQSGPEGGASRTTRTTTVTPPAARTSKDNAETSRQQTRTPGAAETETPADMDH